LDDPSSASTGRHSSADIPSLEERSEIYAEAGKYAQAMADVAVIFEISPDKASSYNQRCWIRAIAGQELDLALADCNKALELHPNDAATLDSRGLVNYKAGHLQDALADYGAAVSKDSSFADALYMRGIVERKLGDTATSDTDMAKAVQEYAILPGLTTARGVTP
jgi:tetratricopeptide (TPR) repeat protein